jgi:LysM repeat protein
MKEFLLLAMFCFICYGAAQSQYINTDMLIVVAGEEEPIINSALSKPKQNQSSAGNIYFSDFLLPGNGGNIISRYGPRSGRMHYGTDVKMQKGDTVYAVSDGVVSRSNYGYGFGNIVIVSHKNNLETYYAHLSKFLVKKGNKISRGEPIGLAGSTGRARGPHLHFEMREKGKAFDPEMVFDFEKMTIREEALHMESLAQLHRVLRPKGYGKKVAIPEFYIVRSGDSLWRISRKYKITINEICRLNKISENSILQIGQALRLY